MHNISIFNCGIFVSEENPFLGVSPNGLVNKSLIWEVKCLFKAVNEKITTDTVPILYWKMMDVLHYITIMITIIKFKDNCCVLRGDTVI